MVRSLLLILSVLIVWGCLQVEDTVEIKPSGVLVWQVKADWEKQLEFPWLADSLVKKRSWYFADSALRPEESNRWSEESNGTPLRQSFYWGEQEDTLFVFQRKVMIQRDYASDDGSYQDHLMMEQYRGAQWHFRAKFPGRIRTCEPQPEKMDSLEGLVEWKIPLTMLVGKGHLFHVQWSKPDTTIDTVWFPHHPRKQPWGILVVVASLLFITGFILGRISIRYRRRKRRKKEVPTLQPQEIHQIRSGDSPE